MDKCDPCPRGAPAQGMWHADQAPAQERSRSSHLRRCHSPPGVFVALAAPYSVAMSVLAKKQQLREAGVVQSVSMVSWWLFKACKLTCPLLGAPHFQQELNSLCSRVSLPHPWKALPAQKRL